VDGILRLLVLYLGRDLKFSILDPRKYDLEISRFNWGMTALNLGAPRMFANPPGTIVMFDDPMHMTFKDSFVDYFYSGFPVSQRRCDTVEQLGGV